MRQDGKDLTLSPHVTGVQLAKVFGIPLRIQFTEPEESEGTLTSIEITATAQDIAQVKVVYDVWGKDGPIELVKKKYNIVPVKE